LFQAFICFSFVDGLRVTEERANDLERRLKASEEACQKAEKDVAGVEDLRRTLQTTENALSD
jgi:flagellar motility protein MotE (MotC chaperone)